jgi:hypothetical protein
MTKEVIGIPAFGQNRRQETPPPNPTSNKPTVPACYFNHVWSVDITIVLSTDGFWTL